MNKFNLTGSWGLRRLWRVTVGCSLLIVLLFPTTSLAGVHPYPQALANTYSGFPLQQASTEPLASGEFMPGEIVVGLRPAASTVAASGVAAQLAGNVIDAFALPRIADEDGGVGMSVLIVRVPDGDEAQAIQQLQQDPNVLFAEPNWIIAAADNETIEVAEPEQPYLVDDPLYAEYQWSMQRSSFSRAWQMADSISAQTSVLVAVIDSGVDFEHPDLAGKLLPGYNYLTDGATPPIDDFGHGTHVTGVIAALTNNGQGIMGGASAVEILPYKVLGSTGGGVVSDLAQAVIDAANFGARVINLSVETSSYSSVLESAVNYAEEYGALVVAAAGNSYGRQVLYPAKFETVMAVTALSENNFRTAYDPVGPEIEIAAGGGDGNSPVMSTWPSAPAVRAKCQSSGRFLIVDEGAWYCAEYGTSMAAPHVSAAAALVWSVYPTLNNEMVRTILKDSAQQLDLTEDIVGAGLLDAAEALRYGQPSDLTLDPPKVEAEVIPGGPPLTTLVTLRNESGAPIRVSAIYTSSADWYSITNVEPGPIAGEVRYDRPAYLNVVIEPSRVVTGVYSDELPIVGTRPDGSQISQTLQIVVISGSPRYEVFLPLLPNDEATSASSADVGGRITWEDPIEEPGDKKVYDLGDSGSIVVSLPFAFPLPGPEISQSTTYSYTRLRIYADGFVQFLDDNSQGVTASAQNSCLPGLGEPKQAVFGWWADLDASGSAAEVATFRPGADRFVIQYKDISSGNGVAPPYSITFQIVLFQNGDIRLSYGKVPKMALTGFQTVVPVATVGVQARGGLFYNQISCVSTQQLAGTLPQTGQAILIKSEDIY